jgi:uncharacterized membrane protein
MKKVVILVLLVLLSGCISISDTNLKTVVEELRGEEKVEETLSRNILEETSLMFDDTEYVLNIYNPNILVEKGETAEIGLGIMNIYSQPSQFDLRVDTEYTTIVGNGVYLEPDEFSVKSILVNAPNEETNFIIHVYLDRNGNNIAAKDVTVKVI